MTLRIFGTLSMSIVLVVACGGVSSVDGSGGSGAAGAAGTTATGGEWSTGGFGTGGFATGGVPGTGGVATGGQATGGYGNVPSQCAVDTVLPPPYATTFKLVNTQSFPLYLYQGCWITHSIRACADGYSRDLPTDVFCMTECSSGVGCVVCGACYSQPLLLRPGDVAEIDWSGQLYTTVNGPMCSCFTAASAPPGMYRIDVPVFLTADQAQAQAPSFIVSQQFQLPSAGNTVTVNLFVGV